MSIKTVHLFFISVSILLSVYFTYWNWNRFDATQSLADLIYAAVALLLSAALVIYLARVWQKFRKMEA